MHKIPLNLVKPSPNPIRKSWDEQKMQELAQSIKEQGVIVPIKVRPNGAMTNFIAEIPGWYRLYGEKTGVSFDFFEQRKISGLSDRESPGTKTWRMAGFEVVYGHRRIEAARRAGLEAIPAIVESLTDEEAEEQALIENVARADMHPLHEGIVVKRWKTPQPEGRGWSTERIRKILGKSRSWVNHRIALLDETEKTKSLIGRPIRAVKSNNQVVKEPLGERHIRAAREAGIKDADQRERIATKAYDEQLTASETSDSATAYVAAPTLELKQAILETSGKLGSAERITQVAEMKLAGRHVADGQEVRREKAFQEFDSAVKDFLDAMKMFDRMISAALKAGKYGKFSPEAKPFTIRKIDRLIDELETLKEALSNG